VPEDWRGDGAITLLSDPALRRRVSARCRALVDVGLAPGWSVPRVVSDNAAIGGLAVAHFRSRGYRHLACLGHPGVAMFAERVAAFTAAVGGSVTELVVAAHLRRAGRIADLGRRLARLPGPLGLFCAQDVLAVEALAGCEEAGLAVPGRVAILGVDDVDLLCTTQAVPLASIDTDQEGLGAAAAMRLAGLLAGHSDAGAAQRWPPRGVVVRASAEALGCDDVAVCQAVAAARRDPAMGVRALAAAAGLSPQALDRRCSAALGMNPGGLLRRMRLERVEAALAGGASLAAAARAAGIADARGLCALVRQRQGLTPAAWRAELRRHAGAGLPAAVP
jgi:AraC-like DNA-binding protein